MSESLLTSTLLARAGFRHGFSTRFGGVSEAPFASMNLARVVGDDPANVEENYRRFASMVGVDPAALFETSQVHGDAVRVITSSDDVVATRALEADALVGAGAGVAVGVRVADCVPILLADPKTGLVAAVHAGWRGCVARVLDRAVDALESLGARGADLLAAVGPHIGPESFEVGADVAEQIAASASGASVIVDTYDKPHVDLFRVVSRQLEARGLSPAHVDRVSGCTFREPERFHSFRRDGKRSGRHLGAIASRVGSTRTPW